MNQIATRIAEALERRTTAARVLQDALSGAFSSRVRVKPWLDGALRAMVPADALASSGVVVTESVIAGVPAILTGTPKAVENAERRVAKRAGPGWVAKLIEFDAANRRVIFEVAHGSVPQAASADHP